MSPARFHPLHIDRTGEFTLPLPLRHAFPLFSPEGETAWVPGWEPLYLHPDHPSNAHGTVFQTGHLGELTLWLVLRYDPEHAIAEYARFSPGSRIGLVQVQCEGDGPASTRVRVTYSLTALTQAGNTILASLSPDKYAAMLQDWRAEILRSQEPGSDTPPT